MSDMVYLVMFMHRENLDRVFCSHRVYATTTESQAFSYVRSKLEEKDLQWGEHYEIERRPLNQESEGSVILKIEGIMDKEGNDCMAVTKGKL